MNINHVVCLWLKLFVESKECEKWALANGISICMLVPTTAEATSNTEFQFLIWIEMFNMNHF